jgi:hypothetical protein
MNLEHNDPWHLIKVAIGTKCRFLFFFVYGEFIFHLILMGFV